MRAFFGGNLELSDRNAPFALLHQNSNHLLFCLEVAVDELCKRVTETSTSERADLYTRNNLLPPNNFMSVAPAP